jgi:hypothetical protein
MKEHPKVIEKRHFTCRKCGYNVQVHGEMYFDFGCHNYIGTFCCKRCKILYESIISQRKWLKNGKPNTVNNISLETLSENYQLTFELAKIEDIICLNCGTTESNVWNKNSGACPICGAGMTYSIDGEFKVDYEK